MIILNHYILPHWILKHQILMNLPSYVNHHLSHSLHPHPPHSLQLGLVKVDALREQTVCGAQGNSDHPPAPSHVLLAKGGASVKGGTQDKPNSWHGCSVGISIWRETDE